MQHLVLPMHSPLRIYYTSLCNSITKLLPPPFSLFIFLWILRAIQAEGIWELNTVSQHRETSVNRYFPLPLFPFPWGELHLWASACNWTRSAQQTEPIRQHLYHTMLQTEPRWWRRLAELLYSGKRLGSGFPGLFSPLGISLFSRKMMPIVYKAKSSWLFLLLVTERWFNKHIIKI